MVKNNKTVPKTKNKIEEKAKNGKRERLTEEEKGKKIRQTMARKKIISE